MKVLFDDQIFTLQKYGGISRYFCELMDQFTKGPNISIKLAMRYSKNENLLARSSLDKCWSKKSVFLSNSNFPYIQNSVCINLLNRLQINQRESIRQIQKQKFDIFHPTYYNPYFLEYIAKKPYVLTVYDMIHELYPEFYSARDLTSQRKKKLIESATKVIAISNNTRNDILRLTDLDPDRVTVIYLGNPLKSPYSLKNNEKTIGSIDLRVDYLLFVGKRSDYKNFTTMISSIAILLRDNKSLFVYCAGGGPFTPVEVRLLKSLNIYPKVLFIHVSSDKTLINLYKNARAFIFPSLYEGFGFPILEAFSCGCPLVASNTSSLLEIAGDASCYFDPQNPDSICGAVESILSNSDYRDNLIKKGYKRLKCFSWEKTFKKTKCVYENILDQLE